jgi:hypothetical protein
MIFSHEDTKRSARAERPGVVVDYAPQTAFEHGFAKVDEQTQRQIHRPQISKHLLAVHGKGLLDRFQFDNEPTFNEKIDLESIVYYNCFVLKRNQDLSLDVKPGGSQLCREQGLVSALQQARAQLEMYAVGALHYDRCERLQVGIACPLRVFA